ERRELRHASPHAPKPRKDRIVALVERGVALRAEPFDPLGAREDLTERCELDVFARLTRGDRLQRRPIELAKLKGDQVEARVAILRRRADSGERVLRRAQGAVSGGGWRK